MVKEEILNGKKLFTCQECKFTYKEKKWAEECEQWCKAHHTCNIEIIKHAINIK